MFEVNFGSLRELHGLSSVLVPEFGIAFFFAPLFDPAEETSESCVKMTKLRLKGLRVSISF